MSVATSAAPRKEIADAGMSTSSLAAMLIGSSVLELLILRIGTRIAVHIPDLEAIRGPYQLAAAAGRLAFAVAVLLLVLLLARLVRDLHRRGLDYLSASVLGFAIAALLGRTGVIDRGVLAAVTTTVVLVLALGVVSRCDWFVAAPIALFALAFAVAATAGVLYGETSTMSTGTLGWLTLRSEEMVILAAMLSGPLVRRSLGETQMPPSRIVWMAVGTAVVVIGATIANPSNVHILMLWNFGLTGTLPAALYGLAAASLVVSIASALRHGRPSLAAVLVLLPMGGIGLISTYQSGLAIAGLALAVASDEVDQHPATLGQSRA